ncbi:MAG: TIGR02186 family protein [Deltaproteobacteria bacterium]|nr:TIGR02186 family protein [Deltaproteobacteria bacterium]
MRRIGPPMLKVCLMCAGFLVMALWGRGWAAPLDFTVQPNVVRIGTWYDGAKIHVRAHIPRGCQAVIELSGNPGAAKLMRKERSWGMWKNGEEILEQGAPGFYLAMSTDSKLLSSLNKNPSWGYDAIAGKVSFTGDVGKMAIPRLFEEFLRLKERSGCYGVFPGQAKIQAAPGKRQLVKGVFDLPAHWVQGDYRVDLSVVKDGRVLSKEKRSLKVALVGFPSAIFELAHKHALTYGLLAAGIAILSGFLVGLIFQLIGKKE